MAWGGRNFPLSGQNWKNPDGTYPHDWTLAMLIGAAGFVAFLLLAAFAFGMLG